MKKTNSYTKMTKVKSNKKSAGEGEPTLGGFTGIASGGSTSMLKTQSASLKPLTWKSPAAAQIL